jgi:hypothetical protein
MIEEVWTGFIWLKTGINMISGECGNETPCFIKRAGFIYSSEQLCSKKGKELIN